MINTSDRSVELGSDYTLWYEYPSGDAYVMKESSRSPPQTAAQRVAPGETVVLWSQRTDLGGEEGASYASEAQFRQAMRVPSGSGFTGFPSKTAFAENDRGFALKKQRRRGDLILSLQFHHRCCDSRRSGGQSRIPDFGSNMLVYEAKKPTTAGLVYAGQLNGQRPVSAPANLTPGRRVLRKSGPTTAIETGQFGSGSNDVMECLEVYNTTGRPVDLNAEYELVYRLKENSSKSLPCTG